MKTKTAAIFPGQGTQQPGMGRWMDEYPAASRIFDQAEALGFPARAVCFETDADALKQTETAQPALFTVAAAAYGLLRSNGAPFQAAAGHSLGEYAALYAAGVVSFQDALRLVMERGRFMAKAAKENPGGMSAILGLEDEAVEEVCAEASQGADAVVASNYNCPGQVVISGSESALERAALLAKEAGARLVAPLPVSGAFHSPRMRSAQDALEAEMQRFAFHPPDMAFYSNVTGEAESSPETIRALSVQQVAQPVLWTQSLQRMYADGYAVFVEAGSGKGLTSLVKRTIPSAAVYSTDSEDDFKETIDAIA